MLPLPCSWITTRRSEQPRKLDTIENDVLLPGW